jgi:hypothetical protein
MRRVYNISFCAKDAILTPENVKHDHISGSTNVVLGTVAFLQCKIYIKIS